MWLLYKMFENLTKTLSNKVADAVKVSTNKFSDPSRSIRSVAEQAGNVAKNVVKQVSNVGNEAKNVVKQVSNVGNEIGKEIGNLKVSREGLPSDAYYYLYKLPIEQLKEMTLVDRIRFVKEEKRKEEEQAFKNRMNAIQNIEEERSKKWKEERKKEELRKEMLIKEKEEKKRKAEEAYNNTPKGQVEMLEKTIDSRHSVCRDYLIGAERNGADEYYLRLESDKCNEAHREGRARLEKCKLNLRNYEESIKNNNPIPFICGGSKTRRRRHSKKTATRKSRRHHKKSKKTRKH